jgi:hypothetical protein
VARPLDLLVKRPDEEERPLPSGTRVVDVFDAMDQSMLILGAPGSGKTTLLLELARDLLTRATNDPAHPIPVVFPLSTWAQSRKPLVEWLQDELNLRYDVPRKVAQEWVASDEVLPLLDGLDEVKAEHRLACVEAINAFRQSHGLLPLVITSRTADYEALAEPLRLQGAIMVRPLTREQVTSYLTDLGTAGELLRAAIQEDPSQWDLLDSPLMLNIITVAYAGQMEAPNRIRGTVAVRRDHLFGSYVHEMLRRRGVERRYTPEQTMHWLMWLADQMARHSQTVFYLERLQRDWLPAREPASIRRAIMVVVGLVVGLLHGLVAGLLFGLPFGLFGVLWGALFGVLGAVASTQDLEIHCVETVRWSWSGARVAWNSFVKEWFRLGAAERVLWVLRGDLVTWPLIGAMLGGLSFAEVETKSFPNEGIRRSARNALVVGLGSEVISVLVLWLFFGLLFGMLSVRSPWLSIAPLLGLLFGMLSVRSPWLSIAPLLGLLFGMLIGLFGMLYAEGSACIEHVILRLWLIRNGSTPWNYVRFLDHAAERILLRKVGGGYSFIHRMLLDYFAARYVEPSSGDPRPAKSSSIEDELQIV